MLAEVTLKSVRTRMNEHLLAVEEVPGGLDLYVQQLERRLARVEGVLR